MSSDGEALTGLWFDGQKHFPQILVAPSGLAVRELLPVFASTCRWLETYYSGVEPGFTPPLSFRDATPFQAAVWQILESIPYGAVMSYNQISAVLNERGISSSPRAVGGAVGRNPISLIIPCHRVIGADGRLTGYAAGIERKRRLLILERGQAPATSSKRKRNLF